ncbi:MAG: type II toxin-antitoxin system VapC family toxin [Desulfovibrio sp.]|jgi:PIN domain nuclease of toxin-antitoxin system|nr:type II toxin-antitoxin system VapC family toxin [Desulfovibrio sp.]
MKLLLDTHLLIWAAAGTLPARAQELLTDGDNVLYFSPASIWEIVIKKSLGRNDFKVEPEVLRRGLLDNQYEELCITSRHTLGANDLPLLHKDPFDRILLAQAKSEGMSLVTSDAALGEYPGPVIFISR